jgi:hypothetical protein
LTQSQERPANGRTVTFRLSNIEQLELARNATVGASLFEVNAKCRIIYEGTEIGYVRFVSQGGPLPVKALLQPCFGRALFGQAMKQPVSERSIVPHDVGAIIGLFALVAITLACIGSFALGWW